MGTYILFAIIAFCLFAISKLPNLLNLTVRNCPSTLYGYAGLLWRQGLVRQSLLTRFLPVHHQQVARSAEPDMNSSSDGQLHSLY